MAQHPGYNHYAALVHAAPHAADVLLTRPAPPSHLGGSHATAPVVGVGCEFMHMQGEKHMVGRLVLAVASPGVPSSQYPSQVLVLADLLFYPGERPPAPMVKSIVVANATASILPFARVQVWAMGTQ